MNLSLGKKWMLAPILVVAVYSFAVLLFALLQANDSWSVKLPIKNIRHLDGKEWAATPDYSPGVSGWFLYVPTDSSADPKASNVHVFDFKGELGPAHSRHVDIVNLGGGRYSYWEHLLRFSTRDNLPPVLTPGGVSIAVAAAPQLRPAYVWVAWFGAIAVVLLAYVYLRRAGFSKYMHAWPAVLLFALGFYGHLLMHLPVGINLYQDSLSYLLFSPFTTVGYSLLIHAMIYLGSPYYIVILQFSLAALAITYFCREFERVFFPLFALAIGLLLVIKGDTNTLHYSLLTDSLAFSSVLVLAGLWLRFTRLQHPATATLIAALLLISVVVRPALIVLAVPTAALAIYFYRSSKKSFLILAFACVVAPFANMPLQWIVAQGLDVSKIDHYINTVYSDDVSNYYSPYWHKEGRGAGILLGDMLLLQIRLAITDDQQTRYPMITHNLVKALSNTRKNFDDAGTWREQYHIFESTHNNGVANKVTLLGYLHLCSSGAHDCLQKPWPELWISTWQSGKAPNDLYVSYDKLQKEIAIETIEAHPEAFVYVTWIKLLHAATQTLVGYWAGQVITESSSVTTTYWHQRYGLNFSQINTAVPSALQQKIDEWKIPLLPYVFVGAAIFCLLFPLFLFNVIPYNRRVFLLSLFSIAGVSYTLLVCLLEPPIPRYGVPAAPLYLVVLFGTLDVLIMYMTSILLRIKEKYLMELRT